MRVANGSRSATAARRHQGAGGGKHTGSSRPDASTEINLGKLQQLFNLPDPSPFHDRDLDDDAEVYIVGRADAASAVIVMTRSITARPCS
jgi:hypothetical protein